MADKYSPRPPPSVSIGRQLDKEKIDVLAKRVEGLVSNNNALRASADRNEKDTHDIVLYFQREMEIKDDIISRLNEELIKKEGQMRAECERLRNKYEDEILDLKRQKNDEIDELRNRLTVVENDLQNLDSYRRDKEYHDRKLNTLESTFAKEKADAMFAYDEQERKFMEQKAHLLKDLEEQKAMYRANALKEAREAMDAESKKLVIENKRISEELKFHSSLSREIQSEKDKLEIALQTAKREIGLLTEKDQEYARQGNLKSKEIKMLRERVEDLEKANIINLEKFKAKTKELKQSVQKDLEDAVLDATGLKRLLHVKNKELQHMKALAATIINQRSDIEKFLLEALTEVQQIVREERRKKQLETNQQVFNSLRAEGVRNSIRNGRTTTFPRIKPNQMHHLEARGLGASNLPQSIDEKVFMRDLTWEDKELVLRILFAKLNGNKNEMNSAIRNRKHKKQYSQDDGSLEDELEEESVVPPVFISEGNIPGHTGLDAGLSFESSFSIPNVAESEFNGATSGPLPPLNDYAFTDDVLGASSADIV